MDKLKLSSTELLNKKFKGVRLGYDPLEVDMFLDKIISDYKLIEHSKLISDLEYSELLDKISDLEEKNKTLEIENASLRSKFMNIKEGDLVTKDNIHLIKRINQLEKFLFEIGYDPTKIK